MITLVPVAPLTNIAAALTLYPKLAALVPEVVIMGGGHAIGNVTPAAEFTSGPIPRRRRGLLGGFRKLRWFRSTPPIARSCRAKTAQGSVRLERPPARRPPISPSRASPLTIGRDGWRSPARRRYMTPLP